MLSSPSSDQVSSDPIAANPTTSRAASRGQLPAGGKQPAADKQPAGEQQLAARDEHDSWALVRLPKLDDSLPLEQRAREVRRAAIEVFSQTSCWVTFYRLILGADGAARQLHVTPAEYRYWEQTAEFREILEMVTALRSDDDQKSSSAEPLKMLTIRLPASLHESLRLEAEERETSINKLCLSKMLLAIDERFVPEEKGPVRGRKATPQLRRIPR